MSMFGQKLLKQTGLQPGRGEWSEAEGGESRLSPVRIARYGAENL